MAEVPTGVNLVWAAVVSSVLYIMLVAVEVRSYAVISGLMTM